MELTSAYGDGFCLPVRAARVRSAEGQSQDQWTDPRRLIIVMASGGVVASEPIWRVLLNEVDDVKLAGGVSRSGQRHNTLKDVG